MNNSGPLFRWIPWQFAEDSKAHFWTHYGLVAGGFLLAVITLIVQCRDPAPYGRHDKDGKAWGPKIPQRLGHTISDGLSGVIFFLLIFFLVGETRKYANYVFLALWLVHYIHRGFITPWTAKYSRPDVYLGIILGNIFPVFYFAGLNADWIGTARYDENYYYDPRFLLGILLFFTGYVINRYADMKLRALRESSGQSSYTIPRGGIFELVACPNYFGEMLEWFGWSIATWSLAGLVWFLFCSATFLPRAKHNHKWYQESFEDYPQERKALIPFLY
ncbi:3-oxo-5-alpha-steroid 4-dehydrogenase 1-like [Oscarella lobularis]|uniref:3-oxo-5-alpha-steroid 4-dehydrogenase 1-like n=1 Tax=Oscarella lobularis TaxID=121494 RepID=UPI0033139280